MDAGEIAGLIAAGAFLMLVLVLAVPILRLRHTVDAATQAINDLNDRTGPLLGNVNTTIENVNTALGQVQTSLDGVNLQLAKVDTITGHAQNVTRQRRQPGHRGRRPPRRTRWSRWPRSGTACARPPPPAGTPRTSARCATPLKQRRKAAARARR